MRRNPQLVWGSRPFDFHRTTNSLFQRWRKSGCWQNLNNKFISTADLTKATHYAVPESHLEGRLEAVCSKESNHSKSSIWQSKSHFYQKMPKYNIIISKKQWFNEVRLLYYDFLCHAKACRNRGLALIRVYSSNWPLDALPLSHDITSGFRGSHFKIPRIIASLTFSALLHSFPVQISYSAVTHEILHKGTLSQEIHRETAPNDLLSSLYQGGVFCEHTRKDSVFKVCVFCV